MTADSTATLRAAAARLRELAEKATPGPWRAAESSGFGWLVEQPEPSNGHLVAETPDCMDHPDRFEPDARWIATLSPAIAEPLAACLTEAAEHCERGEDCTLAASELALARAILGESHG